MARKTKAQEKEAEPEQKEEEKVEEKGTEEPEPKKTTDTTKRENVEEEEEESAEEKEGSEEPDEARADRDASTVTSPPQAYAAQPVTQSTTIEKPPSTSVTATCNTLVESTLKFFVGGLHPNTDEAELSSYFSKYGQILSAQVMRDLMTGRHRGFGFVTLKVQANTMAVFKDTHTVTGKRVDVRAMQSDVQAALKKKIFVGGLSKALNEEMLEEYFSKFGEVDKVTIMRQLDGTSRGFGFIVFTTEQAADGALRNPTHFVYGNKVDVRAAETRPKSHGPSHASQAYPYAMMGSHGDMYNSASMYRAQGAYDPAQYASMTQQQMQQQYPQYQLMQQQMFQQQMAMAGTYGGYYGAAGQPGATSNTSTANPYAATAAYGPYRGKNDPTYTGSSHSGDPSMNPRNYRQQPY